MNIVIIGHGRFGTYLKSMIPREYSVEFVAEHTSNITHLVNADMVIFAVPIRNLDFAVGLYKQHIPSNAIIVDVCSVKCQPRDVFQKHKLPNKIILTHPMFGPQSAPITCAGQRLVVCSETTPEFDQLFFKELGLSRIDATPEEHDKEVARTQVINHVVGRAANRMGIKRSRFSTATHEKFMDIVDIVNGNSEELFADMLSYNPYSRNAIEDFVKSINRTLDNIPLFY